MSWYDYWAGVALGQLTLKTRMRALTHLFPSRQALLLRHLEWSSLSTVRNSVAGQFRLLR